MDVPSELVNLVTPTWVQGCPGENLNRNEKSIKNENFNQIEIFNPSRTGKPSAEKRVTHIVAQFF